MCNEARLECHEGTFRAAGAPTEAALVVLAEKLGVPDQARSAQLAAARRDDPDAHADGVQRWYNDRWGWMAAGTNSGTISGLGVVHSVRCKQFCNSKERHHSAHADTLRRRLLCK